MAARPRSGVAHRRNKTDEDFAPCRNGVGQVLSAGMRPDSGVVGGFDVMGVLENAQHDRLSNRKHGRPKHFISF